MERMARSIVRVIGVILLIAGFYVSATDAGLMWALGIIGFILIMLS
jgi:hypothetical protein